MEVSGRQRKARKGVDPQTREAINIPAKKVPKFVAGKGLREKIEGKGTRYGR